MEIINIHAAKTHLSRFVEKAAHGEEFILAKNGRPMARLIPFEPGIRPKRKLGGVTGWVADDFDAPDDEIENLFYKSPLFPDNNKD